MAFTLDYGPEALVLDVPSDRVVGAWEGPAYLDEAEVEEQLRRALGEPADYPPFDQTFVPGDKVVIAIDSPGGLIEPALRMLVERMLAAGIGAEDLVVLAGEGGACGSGALASGLRVHEPEAGVSYLASTRAGRRVYLARAATDADVVISMGVVGNSASGRRTGPWTAIFPGLADAATRREYRRRLTSPEGPRRDLDSSAEAIEVSWLLGSSFHVAIIPAAGGVAAILAGRDERLRELALGEFNKRWRFQVEAPADLVVMGVGGKDRPASVDDLAIALGMARGLVRHGGRIVILSQAGGSIGPAVGRLIEAGDPRTGAKALAGQEHEPDHAAAWNIAQAASWADVFLHSQLESHIVEDLGMTPLDRADQVRKLAEDAESVVLLNRGELTLGSTA